MFTHPPFEQTVLYVALQESLFAGALWHSIMQKQVARRRRVPVIPFSSKVLRLEIGFARSVGPGKEGQGEVPGLFWAWLDLRGG